MGNKQSTLVSQYPKSVDKSHIKNEKDSGNDELPAQPITHSSLASRRNVSLPSLSNFDDFVIISDDESPHPLSNHPYKFIDNLGNDVSVDLQSIVKSQPSIGRTVSKYSNFSSVSSGFQSDATAGGVRLNEEVAKNWQPKEYHMMRADARMDMKRRFHAIEHSPYMLPVDIEEQDRLEIQHLVLAFVFGRFFHMPIHDILLNPEAKLLDVGCGPGSWTRDVAKKYPSAQFYGLDMATSLFNGVETYPNISFDQGNILVGLPYPDNHFDAVFQRMLILGIPKLKWDFVIQELIRVTKPNGYIEIVEMDLDFHQTGPFGDIFFPAMYHSFKLRGIDVDIALNITDRMQSAGLELESETIRSVPIAWGGKVGDLCKKCSRMAMESMKPFLSKSFEMSSEEYDKMMDNVELEYSEFQTYYNVISVVGRKILDNALS
ncbi:hypothetical protein HK096_004781 [Nowakowskiella sp. JEL0078]|nr:hypothetical protein HK096_004781 [Nowakowskiella sp. JEL0078]